MSVAPVEPDLAAVNAGLVETLWMMQEALADAEAILQVDQQGWNTLGAGHGPIDVKILTEKAEQVELAATFNPLIKRGLTLGEAYVWGSGVQVSVRDEASEGQDVNEVVQAFLDDPRNENFTTLEGQLAMERKLGTSGEVWLALPTDMRAGKVWTRFIPASQVTRVVSDPEDEESRWFVLREWTVRREPRKLLYPILGYRPDRRFKQYQGEPSDPANGVDIEWDTPVRPHLVNKLRGRGIGYGTAAVPWATAYKTYLEAWHKLMIALSKFAWQAKTQGDKAGQVAQQVLAAAAGSSVVTDPNTKLEAISRSGATFDAGSGRPLAAVVAAAMDVPVTMMLADPGITGARAVAETLDQPTELIFGARRNSWSRVIADVCGWVIDVAVQSGRLKGTIRRDQDRMWAELPEGDSRTVVCDWPEYDSVPVDVLMKAIQVAQQLDVFPPLVLLRLALKALDVPDADDIIDQMTDDDGNFLPPTQTGADTGSGSRADEEPPAADGEAGPGAGQ